ncbi:isomerase [Pollutimonas subterranea]|uniref:Isomerase n=1 Tax=Pollutimonas subterranea TaxID=2045210 RepID=A0A2N4U8J1_9BURK|nr:TIM barrel protein [Pollutimonas subterranea]PLC51334.1 isomerase [Pollutimonas subterranea]
MPKFSANLGFLWPERPLLERIDAAARAGFKAIELHWPYDTDATEVRTLCAARGLTLLGINTYAGDTEKGEFGLGALPGRETDFQQAVEQSIDWCRASGAQAIHAVAGLIPFESQARDTFTRNIKAAADKAAAHGLTLLLEPINQRDKPGYFYSTLAQANTILEHVDKPNVRIMFDAYHVGVTEGDVLMKLEQYLPLIGHVQIAAVPSRAEPDEGELRYEAIFEKLDTLGYKGWVGCEYKPRADTDSGLIWFDKLGASLDTASA